MKTVLVLLVLLLPTAAAAAPIQILQASFGDLSAGIPCDATLAVKALCEGRYGCTIPASPALCSGVPPQQAAAKLSVNYDCGAQAAPDLDIVNAGSELALACGGIAPAKPAAAAPRRSPFPLKRVAARHGVAGMRVVVKRHELQERVILPVVVVPGSAPPQSHPAQPSPPSARLSQPAHAPATGRERKEHPAG